MTRYNFAEPGQGGCFVPDRARHFPSADILGQAASWYGAKIQKVDDMRPTEVLRLDGLHHDEELLKRWAAYVAELGVDSTRVRDKLVIMQDDDGYHLHLSLKTPSASGKGGDMLDLATNDVVSTPLVIHLGHERNWPGADDTD